MKAPTKLCQNLFEGEYSKVSENHQTYENFRVCNRSHAILLSAQGCAIDAIAKIGRVDRDTVSLWIDNWEEFGFDGLEDDERRGRAAIDCLGSRKSDSNSDAESAISASFGQINREIGKGISKFTLKRSIKKRLSVEKGKWKMKKELTAAHRFENLWR
ncbi:MAG: helix-turn-helix domain-containing protein [Acidobacteria bacterium]|jgi:hypothetical protein|nr:helix-turn-helix domain-containing protein [Acidobacteriota bacterium]